MFVRDALIQFHWLNKAVFRQSGLCFIIWQCLFPPSLISIYSRVWIKSKPRQLSTRQSPRQVYQAFHPPLLSPPRARLGFAASQCGAVMCGKICRPWRLLCEGRSSLLANQTPGWFHLTRGSTDWDIFTWSPSMSRSHSTSISGNVFKSKALPYLNLMLYHIMSAYYKPNERT